MDEEDLSCEEVDEQLIEKSLVGSPGESKASLMARLRIQVRILENFSNFFLLVLLIYIDMVHSTIYISNLFNAPLQFYTMFKLE